MRKLNVFIISLFAFYSCSSDENSSNNSNIEFVTIGTQIWQSKNLDVETYRDGTPIPQVTDPTQWANLTTGAWCYYNNDPANNAIYGKLYNWYAVAGIHDNDPSTPNKILAPQGWHIPSDAEWTQLTDFLGGELVAGGKMKSTGTLQAGTGLWESPNESATNESGFTGLPAGFRSTLMPFYSIGGYGSWWSLSESNTSAAWYRHLNNMNGNVYIDYTYKRFGNSVRCVKD
ncbi:fibrobacter succinogenes major paralogous domain-containing protein [uncultured Flavobacterium sp.]|uniref:fibrobacter succinogenes major paralogous domain-containing protein n=1 Tax=uncultured Flavobacterium sp. TaxID=165435 RepID=UPI002606B726|nr:fibrobacter succinogenes major paralogous domain-containing protein [uncultured Flavobacterium sp.]